MESSSLKETLALLGLVLVVLALAWLSVRLRQKRLAVAREAENGRRLEWLNRELEEEHELVENAIEERQEPQEKGGTQARDASDTPKTGNHT